MTCATCNEAPATEGKNCFSCTEELAWLLADAAIEFGLDPAQTAKGAWSR